MNWFHKLMLVLLLFIAMLSFMVWRSSKAQLDLVTDTYYEEEIKYQDRIDQTSNSDALQKQVKIERVDKNLVLTFPQGINANEVNGDINLYFAANKKNDKKISLLLDSNLTQQINMEGRSGNYAVQISWHYQNKSYYTEQKVIF